MSNNDMRILTVRQPWAWAIIHGGKDVENRVRNIAGDYRGPVAIHAGKEWDGQADTGFAPPILNLTMDAHRNEIDSARDYFPWGKFGAIIGVVDLVDMHHAAECVYVGPVVEDFDGNFVSQEVAYCSPWADAENVYHLVLANPRPLAVPIPYKGALGLRRLDADTVAQITEAIA